MASKKRANKSEVFLFWTVIVVGGLVVTFVVAGLWHMNQEKARQELQEQIKKQKKKWEDSESYDDGCNKNEECSNCKRNVECVQCMNDCYNRHGDASSRENPFRDKAIECHAVCWQSEYDLVPQIDFGIEINRKK